MVIRRKELCAMLLLPLAFPIPSAQLASASSPDLGTAISAECWTAKELAAAIFNSSMQYAVIVSDLTLSDAAFEPYSKPIVVDRNLTIMGRAPSSADWPVLDFGFLSSWIQLAPGVTLGLTQITLLNWRLGPYFQAPGIDIIAISKQASQTTDAAGANVGLAAAPLLLVYDVALIQRTCMPDPIYRTSVKQLQRPARFPGQQTTAGRLPTPANCTNTSTAPAMLRCWPAWGEYLDIVSYSSQEVAVGQFVDAGYFTLLKRAYYLCPVIMDLECASRLGTVGCYYSMFPGGVRNTSGGSGGNSSSGTAAGVARGTAPALVGSDEGDMRVGLLAGLLGGFALLALITAVALITFMKQRRRRRRRHLLEAVRSNANTGVSAAKGCEELPTTSPPIDSPAATPGPQQLPTPSMPAAHHHQQPDNGHSVTISLNSDTKLLGELPAAKEATIVAEPPNREQPEMVLVTPLTPPQPGIQYDVRIGEGDLELQVSSVLLGKGSHGRVLQGMYDGVRVAVKLINTGLLLEGVPLPAAACAGDDVSDHNGHPSSGGNTKVQQQQRQMSTAELDIAHKALIQEVEVLARCQHRNVVRLLAACLRPPRICLVMEFMDTSLDRLLYGDTKGLGRCLPLPTVVHIGMQIARALSYLHPTILHRDLKPGNVLISQPHSETPLAKLADFGLSRLLQSELFTQNPEAGTTPYMAPEVFDINSTTFTDRVDMYSFGVLLWEMVAGKRPWEGCSQIQIAVSVTISRRRPPLENIPEERCPQKLKALISSCWDEDPARRPAAAIAYKLLALVQEEQMREPHHCDGTAC